MNKPEFLQIVNDNADDFRDLLRSYHPASARFRDLDQLVETGAVTITAGIAQAACSGICKQIAAEEQLPPVPRFDAALAAGDCGEIHSLLQSAWFGVPESTSCWSIPGFRKACDLLEDPVEEEEEEP